MKQNTKFCIAIYGGLIGLFGWSSITTTMSVSSSLNRLTSALEQLTQAMNISYALAFAGSQEWPINKPINFIKEGGTLNYRLQQIGNCYEQIQKEIDLYVGKKLDASLLSDAVKSIKDEQIYCLQSTIKQLAELDPNSLNIKPARQAIEAMLLSIGLEHLVLANQATNRRDIIAISNSFKSLISSAPLFTLDDKFLADQLKLIAEYIALIVKIMDPTLTTIKDLTTFFDGLISKASLISQYQYIPDILNNIASSLKLKSPVISTLPPLEDLTKEVATVSAADTKILANNPNKNNLETLINNLKKAQLDILSSISRSVEPDYTEKLLESTQKVILPTLDQAIKVLPASDSSLKAIALAQRNFLSNFDNTVIKKIGAVNQWIIASQRSRSEDLSSLSLMENTLDSLLTSEVLNALSPHQKTFLSNIIDLLKDQLSSLKTLSTSPEEVSTPISELTKIIAQEVSRAAEELRSNPNQETIKKFFSKIEAVQSYTLEGFSQLTEPNSINILSDLITKSINNLLENLSSEISTKISEDDKTYFAQQKNNLKNIEKNFIVPLKNIVEKILQSQLPLTTEHVKNFTQDLNQIEQRTTVPWMSSYSIFAASIKETINALKAKLTNLSRGSSTTSTPKSELISQVEQALKVSKTRLTNFVNQLGQPGASLTSNDFSENIKAVYLALEKSFNWIAKNAQSLEEAGALIFYFDEVSAQYENVLQIVAIKFPQVKPQGIFYEGINKIISIRPLFWPIAKNIIEAESKGASEETLAQLRTNLGPLTAKFTEKAPSYIIDLNTRLRRLEKGKVKEEGSSSSSETLPSSSETGTSIGKIKQLQTEYITEATAAINAFKNTNPITVTDIEKVVQEIQKIQQEFIRQLPNFSVAQIEAARASVTGNIKKELYETRSLIVESGAKNYFNQQITSMEIWNTHINDLAGIAITINSLSTTPSSGEIGSINKEIEFLKRDIASRLDHPYKATFRSAIEKLEKKLKEKTGTSSSSSVGEGSSTSTTEVSSPTSSSTTSSILAKTDFQEYTEETKQALQLFKQNEVDADKTALTNIAQEIVTKQTPVVELAIRFLLTDQEKNLSLNLPDYIAQIKLTANEITAWLSDPLPVKIGVFVKLGETLYRLQDFKESRTKYSKKKLEEQAQSLSTELNQKINSFLTKFPTTID